MTHWNVCRRLKFEHRHERTWRRSDSRWARFVVNSAMTHLNMCHGLKCEWTQTGADLTLIARADLTRGSLRGEKCHDSVMCAISTNVYIQTQARADLTLGSLSGKKCHDSVIRAISTNVYIQTQASANLTLIRPLVGSVRGEKCHESVIRAISTNVYIQTQASADLTLGSLPGKKCYDFVIWGGYD